jgi:flagellar biosynthesis/type III secretory pathway M-ring protein FliF/YscJ
MASSRQMKIGKKKKFLVVVVIFFFIVIQRILSCQLYSHRNQSYITLINNIVVCFSEKERKKIIEEEEMN